MDNRSKFEFLCSKGHCAATIAALGAAVLTSGCASPREINFDRSQLFTEIAAGIDRNAPSNVSGMQGRATYNGVAQADFGGFSGTSDATLTADFETQTIAGSLTSWKDLDPRNYELRGQVLLSNGAIDDDGSFTSQMAGNIERVERANPNPVLRIFAGTAEGQIYDSVQGAAASHMAGSFVGTGVSGGFVARQ